MQIICADGFRMPRRSLPVVPARLESGPVVVRPSGGTYGLGRQALGARVPPGRFARAIRRGERIRPPASEANHDRCAVAGSGRRAATQVGHPLHTQTLGDLPQSVPGGREITAQKTALPQLFEPRLPLFGGAAQTVENRGHLARHRRLPRAVQPCRVIHQLQVAAQREPLHHPFPRRIEPAPVLDRAEPVRLLQTRRRRRARHAASAGRVQVVRPNSSRRAGRGRSEDRPASAPARRGRRRGACRRSSAASRAWGWGAFGWS